MQYPILAQMARDYLPIQGSATPSKRAFSNVSLTDSKQCNRLTPDMFQGLQTLKSAYRNGHMSAAAHTLSNDDTGTSGIGGQDGDAVQYQ